VAIGLTALANTTGDNNVGVGVNVLNANTTASNNTAIGYGALTTNTTGSANTASGTYALVSNITGYNDTADGTYALFKNTTGYSNAAIGYFALAHNTTGANNVAIGDSALVANTTGSNNTVLGGLAGGNLTTGSNNIDIGNQGVAAEGNTIRIGNRQTATYIAGIFGAPVTGSPVYVSSNGQLGVVVSSERFKTAIAPMGSNAAKLQLLRPVTFRLKSDGTGMRQYGLIAEEVAKVYPELVIRDEKGRIDGVRYDELTPILLNEVLRQAGEIRELKELVLQMQAGLKAQTKEEVVLRR